MNRLIITMLAATTLAGTAVAQAPQASSMAPHNPAVKSSDVRSTDALSRGHNSFTEAQARKRIAKAGYRSVSRLTKGRSGLWEGTAHHGPQLVKVALDYKGNVSAR